MFPIEYFGRFLGVEDSSSEGDRDRDRASGGESFLWLRCGDCGLSEETVEVGERGEDGEGERRGW